MDGYSVTEAASVLGVPTERVWELLARGVLSGTPDGDTGMRVFLQPRPKPAAGDDPARPNGNRVGAEPERELSPFRELLTEFRGLTERYGQALLALGEARGEVAALRSRVDVLEARMDLRLPMGTQPSASWPAPIPEAPRAAAPLEHIAAPPEQLAPEPLHPDEEEHRARSRGPRRATDSFAEALARAEDPSPPELRPAAAGEAHTPPHADAGDSVEHGLPRELPPADTMPVAEEVRPAIEAEPEPEPEQEPFVEPIAATEVEAEEEPVALEVEPEPVVVEAAAPEVEEAPLVGEDTEPVEAEPEPAMEPTAEAERVEAEPEPIQMEVEPASIEVEGEAAESEPELIASEEAATAEPVPEPEIDFDANRYTTAIEEPDWFEAEADEPAPRTAEPEAAQAPEVEPELQSAEPMPEAEPAIAPASEPDPEAELRSEREAEPEPEAPPDPEPEPVESATPQESAPEAAAEPEAGPDEVVAAEEPSPPHEASAADEETMLWFGQRPAADTGADEMEVAGGTSPSQAPGEEPGPDLLPGSSELDEALSSLQELTRRTRQTGPGETDAWPPASADVPSPGASSWAMPPRAPMPGGLRPGSPATRAYRRLRRIFPG